MQVPSCGVTLYSILRHPVLYSKYWKSYPGLGVFKPPEGNADKWTISAPNLEKACLLKNEGEKKVSANGICPREEFLKRRSAQL